MPTIHAPSTSNHAPLPHEHPGWRDNLRFMRHNLAKHTIHRKAPFNPERDRALQQHFAAKQRDFAADTTILSHYFIDSFSHHAYHDYSRANFPGLPGIMGCDSDSIEAAARSYPLLAAYLHSHDPDSDPHAAQSRTMLRHGILTATDPTHRGYWGKLKSHHQTICEAADLALAVWLSREHVWATLNDQQQQQILGWLAQLDNVQTVDNNWHLFILLGQAVRQALGDNKAQPDPERYARIRSFYSGDGWYRDGAKGNHDYYNAWGFHYPLYWLDQILPDYDRSTIRHATAQFAERYLYLFSPNGFPFFGRSAPYRFAAPCALVAAMAQQNAPNGQYKRAIATLNRHFITRGAIANGIFTQGLYHADRRLLDSYSGTGSSLWSLRTLILLLYATDLDLNTIPEAPLPIEQHDYNITIDAIGLHIIGHRHSQEIIASFTHNDYPEQPWQLAALQDQSWHNKLRERILGRATRTRNNLLRRGVTTYSTQNNLYL